MTHNGYTNYETWAYSLWIDNTDTTQLYWLSNAKEALKAAEAMPAEWSDQTPLDRARYALAERLKEEANEECPDLRNTVWADLLSAAIECINWHEIALHLLADLKEIG